MKVKLITLSIASLLIVACNNKPNEGGKNGETAERATNLSDSPAVADAPIIKFNNDTYDFGKIKQGEKITHTFEFTNTGKSPLIINDVQAGCGCTTPKFDKKPIAPDEKGNIEIGFNSSGQRGAQHKIISVYSNAEPKQLMLHLKGEVLEQ